MNILYNYLTLQTLLCDQLLLDGKKIVENSSQANSGHCEQFLYDPLARDPPSILGCIQL